MSFTPGRPGYVGAPAKLVDGVLKLGDVHMRHDRHASQLRRSRSPARPCGHERP
jgi:hypothetical protein